MTDAVELDGRQGQVATVTAPSHKTGDRHAPKTGTQTLVRGQQLRRDAARCLRTLQGKTGEHCVHLALFAGQPFGNLAAAPLQLRQFLVEGPDLGVQRLPFLHEGQSAVLELRSPLLQALDVSRHRLELPRGGHLPAIKPGTDLSRPGLCRLELALSGSLAGRHVVARPGQGGTHGLPLGHQGLQLAELGASGQVGPPVGFLVDTRVQVLEHQQAVQVDNAHRRAAVLGPAPNWGWLVVTAVVVTRAGAVVTGAAAVGVTGGVVVDVGGTVVVAAVVVVGAAVVVVGWVVLVVASVVVVVGRVVLVVVVALVVVGGRVVVVVASVVVVAGTVVRVVVVVGLVVVGLVVVGRVVVGLVVVGLVVVGLVVVGVVVVALGAVVFGVAAFVVVVARAFVVVVFEGHSLPAFFELQAEGTTPPWESRSSCWRPGESMYLTGGVRAGSGAGKAE